MLTDHLGRLYFFGAYILYLTRPLSGLSFFPVDYREVGRDDPQLQSRQGTTKSVDDAWLDRCQWKVDRQFPTFHRENDVQYQ